MKNSVLPALCFQHAAVAI